MVLDMVVNEVVSDAVLCLGAHPESERCNQLQFQTRSTSVVSIDWRLSACVHWPRTRLSTWGRVSNVRCSSSHHCCCGRGLIYGADNGPACVLHCPTVLLRWKSEFAIILK